MVPTSFPRSGAQADRENNTGENEPMVITEEDRENHHHNLDVLCNHGYISRRVADLSKRESKSLSELKDRLFVGGKNPVVYYETIGMTNVHKSTVSCDVILPDKNITIQNDGDQNIDDIFKHTGYLYQHPVYTWKNKNWHIYCFSNERSRKMAVLYAKEALDVNTGGATMDIVFNVLDRGDAPAYYTQQGTSTQEDLEEMANSSRLYMFDESENQFKKALHAFAIRFEKDSASFGYLERLNNVNARLGSRVF
jgi:hypothetical protein